MKKLKIFTFAFTVASLLACTEGNTQKSTSKVGESSNQNDIASITQLFQNSMQGVEPTKYHENIDANNGLVQSRFPIPKSWQVNHDEAPISIEGPNQLKIYKSEIEELVWSNDPMMQQTIQMSGKTLAQPTNNQALLQNYVRPNAEKLGYRFVKSYDLPEVSGLYQRFFNAMPNTGTQRFVETLGTEWETSNGSKSLIIMVHWQFIGQQMIYWTIQTTELEIDPSHFDEAKNAYLYSMANTQINPQWMQHMNGQLIGNIRKTNDFWSQATAQSAAAHQQRMNAIAARGNASTSLGNTYSDILDISHKGYLNRSNINDAGHAKNVRAINQTSLIGNHETGEHYSVESGSNYYWVDPDGVYIGTDNALFDPNINKSLNNKDWTKFAVEP